MSKFVLLLGVLLIVYVIILTSIMGRIVFTNILVFVGIIFIAYYFTNEIFKNYISYKKIKKILTPFIAIMVVLFLVVEIAIIGFSLVKNTDEADYMIILGAGLRGEVMSLTLHQRMEESLKYIKEHENIKYIVVSGGQGQGESIPEAVAMKRYLVENGINEDMILIEDKSTNTLENLQYSMEIIEKHSSKEIEDIKVKVSTSGFHLFRAYTLSQKIGFRNITLYSCPINPIFIPTYYAREFMAFVKSFIFDIVLSIS